MNPVRTNVTTISNAALSKRRTKSHNLTILPYCQSSVTTTEVLVYTTANPAWDVTLPEIDWKAIVMCADSS